ncbi:unnamed protein product [Ixodes hexagonus]
MQSQRHPKYMELEGLRLTNEFSLENVRQALRFVPETDDVILATYPKCGTHWVQQIIQLILNGGQSAANFFEFLKRTPLIELLGTDILEGGPSPRFVKTHLPLARLHYKSDRAKYVYVARNPWDCCISFFYHTRMLPVLEYQDGTFDTFFELFIGGKTDHGDFFDHVIPWYRRRNEPNILFLTYERLKEDPRETVSKLARFLGESHARFFEQRPDAIEDVLGMSSIAFMKERFAFSPQKLHTVLHDDPDSVPDAMKRLLEKVFSSSREEGNSVNFIRKGTVGDWKGHFSREQLDRMKVWIEEKTKEEPGIMVLWRGCGQGF